MISLFNKKPEILYQRNENSDLLDVKTNPGRGFYTIFPFDLTSDIDEEALSTSLRSDQSLVLVEIDLSAYRDGEIDEFGKNRLHYILRFFHSKEKDMILRFCYDMMGRAKESEPSKLSQVISHMDTVGRICARYLSSIFLVQGLFIRNWGEMHSSRFSDEESLKKLYRAYRRGPMGTLYLAVRTVSQLRLLLDESEQLLYALDYDGLLSPELRKSVTKVGLFDDAMLYDDTDMGTFADYEKDTARDYIKDTCIKVSVGGEVLSGEISYPPDEVMEFMENMRVTYINSQHDMELLNSWKDTRYKDKSLYEAVGSRLGYVLSLDQVRFDKKKGIFDVSIKNHGFSALHDTTELNFVIKRVVTKDDGCTDYMKEQRLTFRISHGIIRPGETFSLQLSEHDLPRGKYVADISLSRIKDKRTIQFANSDGDSLTKIGFAI